ncbi:polysaccharide biosynthesis/export family protein [Alsobacter sp. SYSU BS001988]
MQDTAPHSGPQTSRVSGQGIKTAAFLVGLTLTLFVCLAGGAARAEYRLDSGDVIDLAIMGRSDLNRKATVNPDGNITLPLFGEIHVAGLSLSELRARITGLFAPSQSVRPSDIILDLVETRPIYVAGEVVKPGAYPYRSGFTVIHAVALGGGVPRLLDQAANPATDLGSRISALRVEYLRQQVRIASLTAELADRPALDLNQLRQQAPGPQVEQIAELESRALRAKKAERDLERQSLQRAIDMADEQIVALQNGLKEDIEGSQQQTAELQRVTELSRKGLSNPGRVSEEQRAASLLKSRQMDTGARLARARQDREELRRRLEKVDDRQVRVPKELQDALMALESLRAQLTALSLPGDPKSLAVADNQGLAYGYEILRRNSGQARWIVATEDTPLEPGDLVRVSRGSFGTEAAPSIR